MTNPMHFSTPSTSTLPSIGVVMGSDSDWDVMQHAVMVLQEFDVPFSMQVLSAHRMPEEMAVYAKGARARGLAAIIAGAGGAAHLPGMLAAQTPVPVLGVPIPTPHLQGLDSLYSIVQMPKGVPVATFAIGQMGAANAALFAIALLAVNAPDLAHKLDAFRLRQHDLACSKVLPLPKQQ